MYESGKSRGDLWAFAAIAAVEFGVETNNGVCDDSWDVLNVGGAPPNVDTDNLSMSYTANIQCTEDKGEPNCKVNFPRSFKFQTGRKDCTEFGEESYIGKSIFLHILIYFKNSIIAATKTENHPNPQGNGKMTVDFFKDQFKFNGRETVAIMGAHTFGRISGTGLFPYVWTAMGETLMNNHFYKYAYNKYYYHQNKYSTLKFPFLFLKEFLQVKTDITSIQLNVTKFLMQKVTNQKQCGFLITEE